MKKCTKCFTLKNKSEFYDKKRSKVRKDGSVHSWVGLYAACRTCTDQHNKKNSPLYKQYHIDYRNNPINKARKNANHRKMYFDRKQEAINLIKSSRKIACVTCGYNKTFAALDFHHINPTTKLYGIHTLMCRIQKNWSPDSIDLLLTEVDKCEILCSNCHREHHAKYTFNI